MKKSLLVPIVALAVAGLFTACMKDKGPTCTNNTATQDRHVIDSFITANNFTSMITYNNDGYYGGKLIQGTGSTPAADSVITFDVVMRLLNGTVLDSTRYPVNPVNTIKFSSLNTQGDIYYNPFIYKALTGLAEDNGLYRVILLSATQAGCQATTLQNGRVVPPNAQIITDYRLVKVDKAQ